MGTVEFKRWQIGDVAVTRIVELERVPVPAEVLFVDVPPARIQAATWLGPEFATEAGEVILNFQAFVLAAGDRRIIVDTCIGNEKHRHEEVMHRLRTPFLDHLAQAGFPPDTIDTVLCTHLHADHVGWNTMLVDGKWVPTFAKARYLFGKAEWQHWSTLPDPDIFGDVLGDSIRPVIEAGLVDFVEKDHRLTPEIRLLPTPGHTPGHVSLLIASRGRQALITGDMIHSPLQCDDPDIASNFCFDRGGACRTRRAVLDQCAADRILMIGSHFGGPTAGWITRQGERYRFEPLPADAL
jgi:glyoxylase-like metal-dependent hydrolase (beta-lactamase superfamily II)